MNARTLYILRHAKAENSLGAGGDFERQLSQNGVTTCLQMGRFLKGQRVHPELIVSSPAIRAMETAKIIEKELLDSFPGIKQETELYNAGTTDILQVLHSQDDAVINLMIVGHNPGLSDLVSSLHQKEYVDLATCSLAVLHTTAPSWSKIRPQNTCLEARYFPKEVL